MAKRKKAAKAKAKKPAPRKKLKKTARKARKPAVRKPARATARKSEHASDAKPKSRGRLTAKEKAFVKELERRELPPQELEARRTRLKNLIALGKERGYLT